jgi:hypothetical protein
VTCSAISESACKPGENFINLAAVKRGRGNRGAISASLRDCHDVGTGVIGLASSEYRPGYAHNLVGHGNDDDVSW